MKLSPAIIAFGAAIVLLGYSSWALATGEVISTWFQTAYRPSAIYWITVLAMLILGIANLVAGFACVAAMFNRK